MQLDQEYNYLQSKEGCFTFVVNVFSFHEAVIVVLGENDDGDNLDDYDKIRSKKKVCVCGGGGGEGRE